MPTTLGPDGFGALKIGMTVREAEATGLVTAFDNSGCRIARLRARPANAGGFVHWSPEYGVVSIQGWNGLKTPDGVRIGMSEAEMLRIYPTWTTIDTNGDYTSGFVRATNTTRYFIGVSKGKVVQLSLEHVRQNCFR